MTSSFHFRDSPPALALWCLAALAAIFTVVFELRPAGYATVMFLAAICVVMAPFALVRSQRRIKRYVHAHRYLICRSCRYPVSGLERTSACPECGAEYDTQELERRWKLEFGTETPSPP